MTKTLTIGEIARRAGIQTSAIRYYESVGLLPAPKRVNKQRRYEVGVLQRLVFIQLARRVGFGVRELQLLLTGIDDDATPDDSWKLLATEKIAEMDAQIERTQAAKRWLQETLEHRCKGVNDCISVSLDEGGGMNVTLPVRDLQIP